MATLPAVLRQQERAFPAQAAACWEKLPEAAASWEEWGVVLTAQGHCEADWVSDRSLSRTPATMSAMSPAQHPD